MAITSPRQAGGATGGHGGMARVLMVSPQFPPDTNAGAHRVRLLAPHLASHGWQPTVLAVDPRDYEGRLDPDLAGLVPDSLRIERCRALPAAWTRRLGIGDVSLRALPGLYRAAARLLAREPFDALFVTIPPVFSALLGPGLRRRFGVPFVLDYLDPWVSAWGRTVGGGPGGRPDLKSRLSRWSALVLEPLALRSVDAVTAVSRGTYEPLRARHPWLTRTPMMEIPYGGEPADFDRLRARPRPNPYFTPADGHAHLCYVGTLLPLGMETLRALLRGVALLRERRPELYGRLRLHFFGTSNQTTADASPRVRPVARELGVEARVSEVATRIDYLDALTVQTQATAILLLGSSEPHYTASKLYPALLARRPVLALYHAASSVVDVLRRAAPPTLARIVTYDDAARAEHRLEAIYSALVDLLERPAYDATGLDTSVLQEVSAEALAGRLAAVLDQVRRPRRTPTRQPRPAPLPPVAGEGGWRVAGRPE